MFQHKQIIPAGPSLVRAASVLALSDASGWPYPWLFPGPGSRHVQAIGSVAAPVYADPAAVIVTYAVPEAVKFVLTHVVINFLGGGWNFGSGDLLFNLTQTNSPGPHDVDWFSNLAIPLGSFVQGPWPVVGRLEFDPLDELSWTIQTVQNVEEGAATVGAIIGYTYPILGVK